MPSFSFEKTVDADLGRIFDVATDLEGLEKALPQYFKSVRVLSVRGNVSVAEEHRMVAKKEFVMTTKHVIDRPHTHHVFVIGGDARGSQILEEYASAGDRTRITVDVDLRLGRMLGIGWMPGKGRVKDDFARIVDGFAALAER